MSSAFAKNLDNLKKIFGLLYAWQNDHTPGIRVHVKVLGHLNNPNECGGLLCNSSFSNQHSDTPTFWVHRL